MHPNEVLLRKGYEAFANSDLEAVNALFADDVVFHTTGKNPLAGTYKGKDEVFGFLAQVISQTDGTYKAELHDVLANDEHSIALASVSATRNGKSINYQQIAIYHVTNGAVTEGFFQSTDQYAEDAFWS